MRTERIVYPGFPHHLILRGNNRRRLFSYYSDYRHFIRVLRLATHKHDVALHNCCLMSNHVHLIATPDDELAMPKWVQSFAQRYARWRNDRRDGSGKLFEERYSSWPILHATYLANCSAYVEHNPRDAGIQDCLERYPWSTYRLQARSDLRSEIPSDLWTPSPWYLELGESDAERADAFPAALDEARAGQLEPRHEDDFRTADLLSEPYRRRLERPNRKRAI